MTKHSAAPLGVAAQLKEICHGALEILSQSDLEVKLQEARPLVIKAGFDPTASDLHLGHTVLLHKMAVLQRLGHKVIFLIGDFTGMVGDPSGRSLVRPVLTPDQVLQNALTYEEQVFKVLDRNLTQIRRNSEWLRTLPLADFIGIAARQSVARLLERDDFKTRFQNQQSIYLHEFFYPLLQAYDSVALRADIELGGTDQKFNLLLGRGLMKDFHLPPQVCLTFPLLVGLDGEKKMSKSYNNHIGIREEPDQMFGKLMSLPDHCLRLYFDLLSLRKPQEINELFRKMDSNKLNPRDAKLDLAEEITARFHSPEAATHVRDAFLDRFSKRKVPSLPDIPQVELPRPVLPCWIPKLLKDIAFVKTTSEAKRLLAQGAVALNEVVLKEEHLSAWPMEPLILQCGKRRIICLNFRD